VYPHGVSRQNGRIRLQIKQRGANPSYPMFPNTLEGVLAAAMYRDREALRLWRERKLIRMPKINFAHPTSELTRQAASAVPPHKKKKKKQAQATATPYPRPPSPPPPHATKENTDTNNGSTPLHVAPRLQPSSTITARDAAACARRGVGVGVVPSAADHAYTQRSRQRESSSEAMLDALLSLGMRKN